MSVFKEIIQAEEEELLQRFYKARDTATPAADRLAEMAQQMGLRNEQLTCAFGFNPNARYMTEVFPLIGFATYEELSQARNDIFISDIYKRITLDDVLGIYTAISDDRKLLEVMHYLLRERLKRIEQRIEETVNSLIIDKYKAEIRAIYNGGVVNIDFAEERLNLLDSGFRALLNEVAIIIESKLIPAGEIFFRDTILPEEKRKILAKGLIPDDLIQQRLDDENTSSEEKKILVEYLKASRAQNQENKNND